jgi:hypothetical protein
MALTHIPLGEITEDHLQRLIDAQTAESLRIEYKRETYGGSDDQRREFLADVSSFANAAGGDLIIGMTAAKGVPTGFHPFAGDADAEKLRLEQMARDGLHPRIAKLESSAIALAAGGSAVIVRIPRSYAAPHRVTFKNSARFWARSSAGKYEPNVEELRRIFTDAPLLAERIRAFRLDRIAKIAAGETPITLAGDCLMVLHVVPYSAFDRTVPLSIAEMEKQAMLFPPLGRGQATHRYVNFDGFVVLTNSNDTIEQQHHSYAQVFRSGVVEAVATIDRPDGAVMASKIDKYCVANTRRYVEALARFGVEAPIAVLVSLVGVGGREIVSGIDNLYAPYGEQKLRQDQFHFAEAIFETAPDALPQYAQALILLLEQIWNTAGFASQQTVSQTGQWLFAT